MIGAAAHLSDTLVHALPSSFIMLVLLNIAFLTVVLWFEGHNMDQRLKIFDTVLSACIAGPLHPHP